MNSVKIIKSRLIPIKYVDWSNYTSLPYKTYTGWHFVISRDNSCIVLWVTGKPNKLWWARKP